MARTSGTGEGGAGARRRRLLRLRGTPVAAMDITVGRLLREARRHAGVTQRMLALALGVSTPYLRRYESGRARMAPERLAAAARTLDLPMSYFFQDVPRRAGGRSGAGGPYTADELQLIRCYRAIEDGAVRSQIRHLLAQLGAGSSVVPRKAPRSVRRGV